MRIIHLPLEERACAVPKSVAVPAVTNAKQRAGDSGLEARTSKAPTRLEAPTAVDGCGIPPYIEPQQLVSMSPAPHDSASDRGRSINMTAMARY
jgi:hypothetical protein